MLKFYNAKDGSYSTFVHKSEMDEVFKKISNIANRIKYHTFGDIPEGDEDLHDYDKIDIVIDDVESLEEHITKDFKGNLEVPLGPYCTSLLLENCYRSSGTDGIEYLIEHGAEINRTDILGNNALMFLINNEYMLTETKLKAAQMLLDKNININWLNTRFHTPLMEAIDCMELDMAEFLIDNGAYVICPPAQEECEDESTEDKPTEK